MPKRDPTPELLECPWYQRECADVVGCPRYLENIKPVLGENGVLLHSGFCELKFRTFDAVPADKYTPAKNPPRKHDETGHRRGPRLTPLQEHQITLARKSRDRFPSNDAAAADALQQELLLMQKGKPTDGYLSKFGLNDFDRAKRSLSAVAFAKSKLK